MRKRSNSLRHSLHFFCINTQPVPTLSPATDISKHLYRSSLHSLCQRPPTFTTQQPLLPSLSSHHIFKVTMTLVTTPSQKSLEDHNMSRASGAARFAMAHAFLASWFENQRSPRSHTTSLTEAMLIDDKHAPATTLPPRLSFDEANSSALVSAALNAHSRTRTSASSTKLKASVRRLSSWVIAWVIRRLT